MKGNEVREGIGKSYLKVGCPDYLKHVKGKIVRQFSTQTSCASYYTYDSPDMFLKFFRCIQQNFPDVIKNSSMGRNDSVTFISLQATEMVCHSVEVFHSKQLDTICNCPILCIIRETYMWHTSTWDDCLQKSTMYCNNSYKNVFKWLFSPFWQW